MTDSAAKVLGLPYNELAEKAVVEHCLNDSASAIYAASRLEASDFHDQLCRTAFQKMTDMMASGKTATALTVHDAIGREHGARFAEPLKEIVSLPFYYLPQQDFEAYCAIVKRDSVARRTVVACEQVATLARESEASADEIIGYADEAFGGIPVGDDGNFANVEAGLDEALCAIKRAIEGETSGLMCGFEALDGVLCGIQPQNLAVLAARPGVGKTAFALNMALAAAKSGTPAIFFSLEMSKTEIFTRLLCMHSGVPLGRLRKGFDAKEDMPRLLKAKADLEGLPIHISDAAMQTVGQIRSKTARKVREVRRKGESDVAVFVDYLQLVRTGGASDNRSLELSAVTRGLKMMAKDLEVPVVALSQLNRAIESRATKHPLLSDLRESGAIEQDADIVMFIDRSMNADEAFTEGRPDLGEARVIVAKHRNGECGTVDLSFEGATMTFSDACFDGCYHMESPDEDGASLVYEGV